MLKFTFILATIIAIAVFAVRFSLVSSSFLQGGIIEGLQSCKLDSDCTWVDTGCCGCDQGGKEILISKDKQWMYDLLIKPLCLEEQVCQGENMCHDEEVYCDRKCKFGERQYTKPLLLR